MLNDNKIPSKRILLQLIIIIFFYVLLFIGTISFAKCQRYLHAELADLQLAQLYRKANNIQEETSATQLFFSDEQKLNKSRSFLDIQSYYQSKYISFQSLKHAKIKRLSFLDTYNMGMDVVGQIRVVLHYSFVALRYGGTRFCSLHIFFPCFSQV